MKEIPTADSIYEDVFDGLNIEDNEHLITRLMIDFAKLHCEAQLKEIIKKAQLKTVKVLFDEPKEGHEAYMDVQVVDLESILNSYPLNLIK